MNRYDPKKKRPTLTPPALEQAILRGVPQSPAPLGELPGAANAPAVQSVDDLLRCIC